MTDIATEIPLNKLVPSKDNVRRTNAGVGVEQLAANIAVRGVLQNLNVRPLGQDDKYEVIAGGRRFKALKLLVKQKRLAKDAPIRCLIKDEGSATEIGLAENMHEPMHPADQFEAFARLHREELSVEDIAARFGVTPHVVTQRLKLAAVSPLLMAEYREGAMNLDQLTAFAITDDHAAQQRVWQELGWNKSRSTILQALSAGQVASNDRRAVYVGTDAYLAAGGAIMRDLFEEEGSGFFSDAALLTRLADEKLATDAEQIRAEGWKWVEVDLEFDYGRTSEMRRIYPAPHVLTPDEENKIEELTDRYNTLCDEAEDEASVETQAPLEQIDQEIEAIRGEDVFAAEDKAIAGVFVSLGRDGKPRVERGFVRRDDDPKYSGGNADTDEADGETPKTSGGELPESLVAELTAYRTAAIANELAQQPHLALVTVVHALAAQVFYGVPERVSCLLIKANETKLSGYAKNIGENRAVSEMEARHAEWGQRLPVEVPGLWAFVLGQTEPERTALLAHCVGRTVDAIVSPKSFGLAAMRLNASVLATGLGLNMSSYWQPTVESYFGRLTKTAIAKVVREAVSPEAAQTCEGMKKAAMADGAEKLLAGANWLPEVLRTPTE